MTSTYLCFVLCVTIAYHVAVVWDILVSLSTGYLVPARPCDRYMEDKPSLARDSGPILRMLVHRHFDVIKHNCTLEES